MDMHSLAVMFASPVMGVAAIATPRKRPRPGLSHSASSVKSAAMPSASYCQWHSAA
jgi:hypothetical protein